MRRSNEAKTVLGDFLSFVQRAERSVQGGASVSSGSARVVPKPTANVPRISIPTTTGCIVCLTASKRKDTNAPFAQLAALSHPERPMYVPAHFEENRPEVLHQLIVDQSFGTL